MKQFLNYKIGVFVLLFLGTTMSVHAQKFRRSFIAVTLEIKGLENTTQGKQSTYTVAVPKGVTLKNTVWSVKGEGAVIVSYTTTSATVLWNSPGNATLHYNVLESNQGKMQAVFEVSTTPTNIPEVPAPIVVIGITCNSATLQKYAPAAIPEGLMWYWQGTTKYGTNTSFPATSDYPVSTQGIYRLRARNQTTGVWSERDRFEQVNFDSAVGNLWYADTDNDGKGDPNDVVDQCNQPFGYVANNNDLCPTIHGQGSADGCVGEDPNNQNYIYTITAQIPTPHIDALKNSDDAIENITYFDGLGRPKQRIGIRQSPQHKDIVSPIVYDAFGRQTKTYLPYVATVGDGLLKQDPIAATHAFYNTQKYEHTPNPYSEKVQEASPLGRIIEQTAPGSAWQKGANLIAGKGYSDGHSIKVDYDTNTASEVRNFDVSLSFANKTYTPTLTLNTGVNNGYYRQATLHKTTTKDENWTPEKGKNHTTEEFKNLQGQVLLKRTYAATGSTAPEAHDTYYVYDSYGNLTYVLPPKANTTDGISDSELAELCYQYTYDHRNRLVAKKIPGKGWESIVYDNLDRPVLTQDALQSAQQKWLFTKYDILGRVVYTGIYTTERSRISLQNTFAAKSAQEHYETKQGTSGSAGHYYSNAHFPVANTQVLTLNYYDSYVFDLAGADTPERIGEIYDTPLTQNVKSLATGSKVKVLGTQDWITTVNYYDEKARPIYSYTKNEYLNTTETTKTKLDFVGKVLETTSTHTNTDDILLGTQTVVDYFDYDPAGRLVRQTQKIGRQAPEVLVHNTYDAMGQLSTKSVGGKTTQTRLQEIDYAYNIRGWLKNINQDQKNDNDLFNFTLRYNNPSSGAQLFNGNIAQTSWNTANTDPSNKTYTYGYDALNRITHATGANTGNYDLNSVSYDKNGNILALERNGHTNAIATEFGQMDALSYSYDTGNQLIAVTDESGSEQGFSDGNLTGDDYGYDVNGNMVKDANKKITSIEYNHLNLPTKVVFENQDPLFSSTPKAIEYVYDASGVKLSKKVHHGLERTTTGYAGNFVYENNELQFFNHAEGYVKNNDGKFTYIYQYKDHLGNVRLSYSDSNNDGAITVSSNPNESEIIEESNYYPFGLKHKGYNNVISSNGNATAQKFGYNGIEYEESLGLNLNEMAFRSYDPAIGRFNGIDPVTHYSMGTSVAFDNNPIFWADPSGADAQTMEEWHDSNVAQDEALSAGASWNQSLSVYDNSSSSGSNKSISDIIGGQLASTEDGGRSTIDFKTGESVYWSKEQTLAIFKEIVNRMNEYIIINARYSALIQVFDTDDKTIDDKNMFRKLNNDERVFSLDVSHIAEMIGSKPLSSFWGAVSLDNKKNVNGSSYGNIGPTIVNFDIDQVSFTTANYGGLITGMGQAAYIDANPNGVSFGAGSSFISFKTKKGYNSYLNYFKKIESNFVRKFKKIRKR
ncbi:DUF6443 domain-containing protein, partial [Polaribacter sp.]|nr:DUF6443 domain-containing protein [Polaribacter sp.]